MNIVIIIPTYNERENIISLIPALEASIKDIPYPARILVVDDSSPDGTSEAVRGFMARYQNIHLLTGAKRGLGRAYISGIKYSLTRLNADVIIEMDADLSHNPMDIPRLIRNLSDCDFVIGSRYVTGGKLPKGWGVFRKCASLFGNVYARRLAGIPNIKDCTSGFRAIKTDILKKIDVSALNAGGYYFQVSLLRKAILNGARVKEIPIEFAGRKNGASKLGLSDIVEFIVSAHRQ